MRPRRQCDPIVFVIVFVIVLVLRQPAAATKIVATSGSLVSWGGIRRPRLASEPLAATIRVVAQQYTRDAQLFRRKSIVLFRLGYLRSARRGSHAARESDRWGVGRGNRRELSAPGETKTKIKTKIKTKMVEFVAIPAAQEPKEPEAVEH